MKKTFILFFCLIFLFPALANASGTIDINTATLQQLDQLTGIGLTYAQRIIDNRPYSSLDGLLKVKGIGPATLQKIKDQGLAYVSGQIQNPTEITQTTTPQITTPQTTTTTQSTETIQPQQSVEVVIYPSGVFINEMLPNPEGADETEEWLELYNSNNLDVDLALWQIKDSTGTPTTFTIPKDTKISANSYVVFKRPATNIMLNNDEDGLTLLTPDGKSEDSVSFSKAPLGQSYNKTASGWGWSKTLTPGAKNVIYFPTTAVAKKNAKTISKITPSTNVADISQSLNEDQQSWNPWILFCGTLGIAVILAIIVLLVKFKMPKNEP